MKRFLPTLLVLACLGFGQLKSQNTTLVDSLETILQSKASDSLKAKALYKLTWHHLRYDLPTSRDYAAQALQLTRKNGDSLGIHRVYHYWGLIHRLESNYDSSLHYFQKVVDFNVGRGQEEKSLQALFNMGVVNSYKGLYDQSLEYYLHTLRIAEKVGEQYMIAEALNSMGLIHKKLRNYPKALQMTIEALDIAETSGDSGQQANYLSNIGGLYAEMEVYDSALYFFHRTLAIDSALGVQWGIGHQFNNIGQVYADLGQFKRANEYLLQGLAVRENQGQRKEITESLVRLAELRNLQEQYASALAFAQRARALALEIGDRPLLRDALGTLAEAQAGLGRYQSAYRNQTAYSVLKDSILSETSSQQINALQIHYETGKKENEIALLTRDKKLQQATIVQQNTEIRALVAVFLLALLVILLLYLIFRNRIRHQKQLQLQKEELHRREIQEMEQRQKILAMESVVAGQEEERKRIAKDLHDGLGNLLANVQMQFSTVEEDMPEAKRTIYEASYQLLGEACSEVRKIAHNMMPSALTRFGLVEALQEMVSALEKNTEMDVDLQVYGLDERLPEKVEVSLYRIVQELLNNIVKHAEASSVIIQLNRQGEELNLLVEDNGVGFDREEVRSGVGLGMESLHSRVRYIDGSLDIDTAPGKGTGVMVHVPLERSGESLEARV